MASTDPAEFSEVMNLFPDHAPQQWATVQKQLTSEYASADTISQAKLNFGSQLKTLAQQFQTKIEEAAPAAAQHTISMVTQAGAIEAVGGLVASVSGGIHNAEDAAKLSTQSIGIMVSVAVALAPETAGVGAAIVGVVGALDAILSSAGLFGKGGGTQIPGCSLTYTTPPDQVIGCWARYGKPVASAMIQTDSGLKANPQWQVFPEKGSQEKNGHDWGFNSNVQDTFYAYYPFYTPKSRIIDIAFPQYAQLEREIGNKTKPGNASMRSSVATFQLQKAFLGAWKKNGERLLNGQNNSTDEAVLAYVLNVFNRAHQPGTPTYITANDGSYIGSLVPKMVTAGLTDNYDLGRNAIRINTGPAEAMKPVVKQAASLRAVGKRMAEKRKTISVPVKLVAPTRLSLTYKKPFPVERTILGMGGLGVAGFYFGGPIGAAAGAALGAGIGYLTGR